MTDVIAHRGASRIAKENTVEAFRAAVQVGAGGIELDARRTADGVLVVHHNPQLSDGRQLVGLRAADLPDWVPTLSEALDACAGAFVNIEIKNDPSEPDFDPDEGVADGVITELRRRSEPTATWLISSFRIETVNRCRRLDSRIPTAWLTANAVGPEEIDDVVASGHTAIHPWVPMVDAALVEDCHRAGLRVNSWTCNDPERAVEMAGWGIDGLCTDVPDEILAALDSSR